MKKLVRLLSLLCVAVVSAFAQGKLGEVHVDVDKVTVPVRVSANVPELNSLALQAFGAHGRYRLVTSGFAYDIRFTAAGAGQVRVDVVQGASNAPVVSQSVNGATARIALLRAADVAVTQTNGLGLRGFFTARLAFVGERTGKKEIYVSDLFLGEAKQVQPSNHPVMKPRWTPDGARLLYTSFFKSGAADIFQYDLGSFQRTLFVSFQGSNYGARSSPNGQQVAMVLS
ncbi:MAG: biopolymer transporter Tol, partial [Opitutaceae bacterium]